MSKAGLEPALTSDIIADNKRRDYQLSHDKKGKKKGFYKLSIEGDFGFGFFGDYRTDEFHSWSSHTGGALSPDEAQAFREKAQRQREAEEKSTKERHQKVATEAQESVLFVSECSPDLPYLKRKQVKPYGIHQSGEIIIIPLSDKKQIWNTQKIYSDGSKRFLSGGKKSGTWFKIPGDNQTVCICEGYATAASVYEATGFTTYMACDASNLITVAPDIRRLHQNTEIIICADNDHKEDRTKPNVGIEKGTKAAALINAKIIWPEHEKDVVDFNDLHVKYGLSKVKDKIQSAHLPETKQIEGGGGDIQEPLRLAHSPTATTSQETCDLWKEGLVKTKKGLAPRSIINFQLIMQNDAALDGVFRYDSFAKTILVAQCPPWEEPSEFKVRRLLDTDYINLTAYFERWGLSSNKSTSADLIEYAASLTKNSFNPASDYFLSLEWDGVPRLDTWLEKYVSDKTQSPEYLSVIGKKFICGMAARAMHPGIKFDTMIIFEGKQYAGKSFLARILATINGEEYFLDDFKDIENKDALMKMQGKLIVEFPEISTLRKAEINDLKAFITRQTDEFRPPYGRQVMIAPRQCVFIGTVNPEGPYLKDITGNRRYWPVSCRDKICLDEIKHIVPQLHAEAAHLYNNGLALHLDEHEYNLANIEQDLRVVEDMWIDDIEAIVGKRDMISTRELRESIGIDKDKSTPMTYNRIKSTMARLGFEYGRFYFGTNQSRLRGFRRRDVYEEVQFNV